MDKEAMEALDKIIDKLDAIASKLDRVIDIARGGAGKQSGREYLLDGDESRISRQQRIKDLFDATQPISTYV